MKKLRIFLFVTVATAIVTLTTGNARHSVLSLLGGQENAFSHLYEIMDKYHQTFEVYTDKDVGGNRFIPSGWMGDWRDISFSGGWTSNPRSGVSCIKITYSAAGEQGNNWAGIYWQDSENNWGDKAGGYNLTGATGLSFWARGENGGEKGEFKIGGINRFPYHDPQKPYQDSCGPLSTGIITLDTVWQEYSIDLVSPDSFAVYTDKDAGGNNHYVPSGWYNGSSNMSFDDAWTNNPHTGSTCIKVTWDGSRGDDGRYWNGVAWQQPEGNWQGDSGKGYDLTGATKLTFWARADEPGLQIKFLIGYPDDSSGEENFWVELDTLWRQYEIDLSGKDLSDIVCGFAFVFNDVHDPYPDGCVFYLDDIKYDKIIEKDLSNIIGGFCWVTDKVSNPDGCTIYLDDVRYNKARHEELRLLTSFETTSDSEDVYIRNMANTYDNALAMLAFLARDNGKDRREARIIGDAFKYAQEHDRYFTDGRLRNAYQSGDLVDHLSGKVRLPGWWDEDSLKWFEDSIFVGTHTGNMAWVMIAWLRYDEITGDSKYLPAADSLGRWIVNHCFDIRGAGGYTGGYEGWEPDSTNPAGQKKLLWKSTEHNLDVYVAFTKLFDATGNSFWQDKVEHARRFVEAMWDSTIGHFWTGTLDDGVTINREVVPLDGQTWGLLALRDTQKYGRAIIWAEENCFAREICGDACGELGGFDFNTDKDGIWWEGTAQMVVAYQFMGDLAKANLYLDKLRKAQTCAPNNNGKGIVAACHDGVSTGFNWFYNNRLHIGATCWFIFAELGYNPFWDTVTAIDDSDSEKELRLPKAFLLSQNYPNPFNPETVIQYQLPKQAVVRLEIYNIVGELVNTLVNETRPAGYHTVRWNGRDGHGRTVASGVYLYSLKTSELIQTRKMILIR